MNYLVKFSLLLALLLPFTAAAHDFEVDGIYYKINGTDAAVTHYGKVCQFSFYTGAIIIPSTVTFNGVTYPVTAIDDQAFFVSYTMTSVSIPESITKIGDYAFGLCEALTNVTIPASVTSIGNNVFSDCYGLNSIIVKRGNSKYDSRDNCNAIIETSSNTLHVGCKNTIIPNSVTTIGRESFYGCKGLTSVSIPNSVTTIKERAFKGCTGLTSVTIPNSVTTIEEQTFEGCTGLTGNLSIPNSVTSIYFGAFRGCSGLTGLTISSSVTYMGNYAFKGCSGLTSVAIESGKANASCLFQDCPAIKNVIVRWALPIEIQKDFFDEGVYQSATLHIPSGRRVFFQEHGIWNKFATIVEEDMPDVEIDSSPFNNLYSRRLILTYTDREDNGGYWGADGVEDIVQAVKFSSEHMAHIKGNKLTHIRFKMWGRYEHLSNTKVFIGSERGKYDLVCQPVTDLHEGWNEVALNEPYLISGDSIIVGVAYLKGDEDYLLPIMWDGFAGNEDGSCLGYRMGRWENGQGTWYVQCMVEGDQVPKYDLHFEELLEPLYNRVVKAGEPFDFKIRLRNWGSMPIDNYEVRARIDGVDTECLPRATSKITRGGGLQEIPFEVIPDEGTPSGCYQLSVTPGSLNGEEYTGGDSLVTPLKVYEHDMGRQKVLVQVYSGAWCSYCVGFDKLVEEKRQERDDLAVVSIHSEDFLSIPAAQSYLSMLYTHGIPDVDLNRCIEKTPNNYRESRMKYQLDIAKAQPAFASVNIYGSFNEENHVLDLTVCGERNEDFVPVEGWTNLTVLLIEDDIVGWQYGYDSEDDYHHPAVLRGVLSDIWGDPVQWNGDKYEMHYNISLDDYTYSGQWNMGNIENMRVVAFLGKPFTGNNYEEIGVVNCNEYKIINNYVGDVNGDKAVNISDINAVIDMILSGSSKSSGDTNLDGVVNISDLNVIIQEILKQ